MNQKRRALMFTQDPEGTPPLREALERVRISPLLPHQLTPDAGQVTIIVIERPAANAATILSNIRSHNEFSKLPVLLILDHAERGLTTQLTHYKPDIFFRPVNATALQRYLERLNGAPPAAGKEDAGRSSGEATRREDEIRSQLTKAEAELASLLSKPAAPAAAHEAKKAGPEDRDAGRNAAAPPAAGKPGAAPPKDPATAGGPAAKKKADEDLRRAKDKPLPDMIPAYSSETLLSGLLPADEAKKGGVPCEHCRRWKARREDPCCSRCGEPLIQLELPGDEVAFEPLGDHTVGALLDLRNAGQNPLWMNFEVVADEQLARRFRLHAERAILDGKEARHQLITFDARGLDLTTGYQGALEILTNERGSSRQFLKLVIERKAMPRVATLGGYVFALDGENVWEFGLANDGGGTLRLQGVRLDTSKDLLEGVPLEFGGPVVIKGGQTAGVRLRVPELNLPIGPHTRRLVWQFEHHPPLALDFAFAVKRPPSLAVQPLEVDLGVVSTSRSKALDIDLINKGGEDLLVDSVKPSERAAAWLECKTGAPLPLRIPPGATGRVELLARGVPGAVGEQRGEVVIRSNSFQNPAQAVNAVVKFVAPTDYEHFIGIDFGTTASCVAVPVVGKDFSPTLLEIDPSDRHAGPKGDARLMPSVLYFHDDGRVLAGREAQIYARAEPHKAVRSIKRSLGLKQKKEIAGREYDAVGVTAQIIKQLLNRAEDGLFQLAEYKTPRNAVLTVPIEFLDSQRRALLEACAQAGLNTESSSQQGIVIDEAQAAALYYLSRKDPGDGAQDLERVLIFDWGGGTLDCALTEIESAGGKLVMRTLGLGGDPNLGGEDIDVALVALLADRARYAFPDFDSHCFNDATFEHNYRSLPVAAAAKQTRAEFKLQAEAAKIALGGVPAVAVRVTPLLRIGATPIEPFVMQGGANAVLEATLTREELEGVLSQFLARAENVVTTLCERAATPFSDVHTILHTGRTSLLPMVRERINAMLPGARDRSDLVGQKVCVAMGAAFWGHIKDLPDAEFEFVGAVNRSINAIGYKSVSFTGGYRDVFVPVFAAQTEFPSEKVVEFRRTKETIKLELYENRGKNTAVTGNPEINFIGSVTIDTRGITDERVPIRFVLDENRTLEIIANDRRQRIELDGE